jgi:hypothetical protein
MKHRDVSLPSSMQYPVVKSEFIYACMELNVNKFKRTAEQ